MRSAAALDCWMTRWTRESFLTGSYMSTIEPRNKMMSESSSPAWRA